MTGVGQKEERKKRNNCRKRREKDRKEISRERNSEPLIRANPDLDKYIYKNINTNKELYFIYSSTKPNGITDIIKINNLEEHPYEMEAYNLKLL